MENITREQYEAMLGVKHGCTMEELENAYYQLLNSNDPAALPPTATVEARREQARKYAAIVELQNQYRDEIVSETKINPADNWSVPTYDEVMAQVDAEATGVATGANSVDAYAYSDQRGKGGHADVNGGVLANIASKVADLVGTKKPDDTYSKAETATKVGGAAAVAAGIYAAGKAAASNGVGGTGGGGQKRGCMSRVGGAVATVIVVILVLVFAFNMSSGGGNSNDSQNEVPSGVSYQDIAFDETTWYRDGSQVYATVAITNENPTRSLVGAEIQADFYDVNGDKCYSGSFGCGYLLPGQTGYACEVFDVGTFEEIDRVDCYVEEGDSTWLASDYDGYTKPLDASASTVEAKTTQDSFYDNTNTTVNIKLSNPNDTTYDNGYHFVAAFYGTDGKLLCALGDAVADDVPANGSVEETMNFYVPDDYDRVVFYAYPTFDSQDLR